MLSPKVLGWSFVAIQIVLLGGIIFLPGADNWTVAPWLSTAARLTSMAGLIVVVAASLGLGTALTATPVPKAQAGLRTGGPYRLARHPIYSGVLLFVVGRVAASGSFWKLAVGVVTVAFFNIKARWEESRLRAAYPDYEEYASRTPRFFPRVRPRSTTRGIRGPGR